MDPRQLKDPAAGVPRELLPHLHLISKHRYPMLNNPSLDTLVQYLVEAPKVMREMSPVQWQYLDAPPDGTLFLTWQPTEYMNMNFASDGYVWSEPEQPFNSEVRGYTLQMFLQRAGYKPQVENVATHARRRYRLVPNNQMGMASPDPHLWLVHYSKASARDQHPATSLQMLPHVAPTFQARQMIQRSGQLPRKEFMLHDRTQWPVISLPAALTRPGTSGQLAAGHRRGASLDMQATIDEEEDVSRGDVLDFITPREISRMRYEQHHEWMEEILESPYATKQIVPSELGLGRQGTLETFTDGFFTAPVSTSQDTVNGKVGKLAPGKAEEFTKHANAKLAEMQADLEKMKQQHIRRMEKLRRTTDLGSAERKMRNMNASDDGYKNIAAQVQELMGRKIDVVQKVDRIAKGGLQDIKPVVPEPQVNVQQHMAAMQAQQQAQMQAQNQSQQQTPQQQQQQQIQQQTPSQAGQHQQPQTQQPQAQEQQQSQPTSQPQPQLENQTQSEMQPQPQPQPQAEDSDTQEPVAIAKLTQDDGSVKSQATPDDADSQIQNNDALDAADIDMGDLGDDVGDDNGDVNDWDMLNDQPSGDNSQTPPTQTADQQPEQAALDEQSPNDHSLEPSRQLETNTPGDTNDFDMVNDFDTNMDTAGDALADYGADDDLNLDDSAFGDAFHHNQQEMS